MRVHFIVWTQRTGLQQKRNEGVPVRQRSIRLEPERAPGKRNGAPTGGGAPLEPELPGLAFKAKSRSGFMPIEFTQRSEVSPRWRRRLRCLSGGSRAQPLLQR